MPTPPQHGLYFRWNYVTNMLLTGCTPPTGLFLQFAKEPALRTLLLLVAPTMDDLVQGMFDPKKGRTRKPGRHGRKRPRPPGLPDIATETGKRLTPKEFVEAVHKFPGFRLFWTGLQVVEGINISAAVVEGVTDTVFDGMAGFFSLSDLVCQDFARYQRQSNRVFRVGAPQATYSPLFCEQVDFAHQFVTTPTTARLHSGPSAHSIAATFYNDNPQDQCRGWLVIRNRDTGAEVRTGKIVLDPGEAISVQCSIAVDAAHGVDWGWAAEYDNCLCLSAEAVGFGESGWLDWLPYIKIPGLPDPEG